jgi:hypothetical protein
MKNKLLYDTYQVSALYMKTNAENQLDRDKGGNFEC